MLAGVDCAHRLGGLIEGNHDRQNLARPGGAGDGPTPIPSISASPSCRRSRPIKGFLGGNSVDDRPDEIEFLVLTR